MTQEELQTITITPEETRESTFFNFGTHQIQIAKTQFGKHDDKPYLDIFVQNDAAEDRARLWLHTPETRRISIDTVRKILVHNQADEEIKQKIRDKFQQIKNLADFSALAEKTIGATAWLKVSEDENRSYERDGEVKKSINRRLYGYQPKDSKKAETAEEAPVEISDADIDLSEIPF